MRWVILVGLVLGVPVSKAWGQTRSGDVGGLPARRKVTKPPKLIKFVEAEYPREKKIAGVTASVLLNIEIGETGTIARVSVEKGAAPDFDEAALAAARRFLFEPAEVDEKPAPARILYRYDFVLRPEGPQPQPPAPPVEPSPKEQPAVLAQGAEARAPVQEVRVQGGPRRAREAAQFRVSAEDARRVPGTQGDVLKVLQNLPGMSRPPIATGQLVVWGSAPKDTRNYVDGVDLPALYHGGGLRGTIHPGLVSHVDLVPGAFGAEYGRSLGGLVRVETRALPSAMHLDASVDTLDGSALFATPLSGRTRIGGTLRVGWLDKALSLLGAPDVGDFFPIPRYRDLALKATMDLREREKLDAVFLASSDALDRVVASADPRGRRFEAVESGFWRAYARYTHVGVSGAAVVTPFVGRDTSSLVQSFGSTPARLAVDSERYGVRASLRTKGWIALTTGIDVLGTMSKVTREGSLTLPPREGDVAVFGQPPGDEVAFDTWNTHVLNVGPHAFFDARLGPLTLTPGIRFDAYMMEGTKKLPPTGNVPPIGYARLETSVAPRAQVRWDLSRRVSMVGAFGQYHQPPEPEELSAVFGTPELGLSRATHVSWGQSLRATDTTVLEVNVFHKELSDLVVRSRLGNPFRARALTQNGEGRAYGAQLLLRQELWHGFFGWASYTLSRSERRYEGDQTYRAFDFDQPHVLTLVASQELGLWTFGTRFRYASGNPRTPVVGGVYDVRSDRFDPVFGAQNAVRIPAFWQLDLRVERQFSVGRSKIVTFADLQNVTFRKNVEEIVYSRDFTRQGAVTGLPFVAVVGVRLVL